jgi:hypothetical protein
MKFDILVENILNQNNDIVTDDLPLNKPIRIKNSGNFIRIDDKIMLGLSGKKSPFKNYLGKTLIPDNLTLEDFYLWVDYRQKKISEDELYSRLSYKI